MVAFVNMLLDDTDPAVISDGPSDTIHRVSFLKDPGVPGDYWSISFYNEGGVDAVDYDLLLAGGELTAELYDTAMTGSPDYGRIEMDVTTKPDASVVDFPAYLETKKIKLNSSMSSFETYNTVANSWNILFETRMGWSASDRYLARVTASMFSIDNEIKLVFASDHRDNNLDPAGIWTLSWQAPIADVALPVGEWIDIMIYCRSGNASTGRYICKIKRESDAEWQTLCDVTDWTSNPDSGPIVNIRHIMPYLCYTTAPVIDHVNNASGTYSISIKDLQIVEGN